MNRAQVFLAAYRVSGNITRAARAANISRDMHHRRMRTDPAYQMAFAEAHEAALRNQAAEAVRRAQELEDNITFAEEELYRRAVYGYPEPVVHQGQFTYPPLRNAQGHVITDEEGCTVFSKEPLTVTKYLSADLQFLLRGLKPETYRERHEVTGKDGGPLETSITVRFVKAEPAAE
jgi:hypothetical protein